MRKCCGKLAEILRIPDFYKHPCKSTCLYNAPRMRTVENSIFRPLRGNEEDLRGNSKMQKLHQILVHLFGAIFAIKLGKMRFFVPKCWQQISLVPALYLSSRHVLNSRIYGFASLRTLARKGIKKELQVPSTFQDLLAFETAREHPKKFRHKTPLPKRPTLPCAYITLLILKRCLTGCPRRSCNLR